MLRLSGNVECRNVIRAIDADESVFQKLCAVFGNCKIAEWAGFHGYDSQVLDGTGIELYRRIGERYGGECPTEPTVSKKIFNIYSRASQAYNNSKK